MFLILLQQLNYHCLPVPWHFTFAGLAVGALLVIASVGVAFEPSYAVSSFLVLILYGLHLGYLVHQEGLSKHGGSSNGSSDCSGSARGNRGSCVNDSVTVYSGDVQILESKQIVYEELSRSPSPSPSSPALSLQLPPLTLPPSPPPPPPLSPHLSSPVPARKLMSSSNSHDSNGGEASFAIKEVVEYRDGSVASLVSDLTMDSGGDESSNSGQHYQWR